MESLPSPNNFTHRATVQYGKAASPHASHSPWKQVCALQPRATSIFIQEHLSCFVNMFGHLNWASTLQNDAQCNSNTTITTHCTTSTELLLSGTDNSSVTWRTSFKLQQCCHYFVSNPCIIGCSAGRVRSMYKCQEREITWKQALKRAISSWMILGRPLMLPYGVNDRFPWPEYLALFPLHAAGKELSLLPDYPAPILVLLKKGLVSWRWMWCWS